MAKKKTSNPRAVYAYTTDDNELNKRFYQRYDENLLFNKALAIACILEDAEKFKSLAAEHEGIDLSRINDKFFEALRAELHFTEMHQFEGFFALLIAPFKALPHWIYLTAYHTSQIAEAIHTFIEGNIEALTGGKAKNDREFVALAVYATYRPEDGPQNERWGENLDNVAWLIRHMAEKYMAGKDEYNSYKHGLRVMTGEYAISGGLPDQAGNPPSQYFTLAQSEDSFGYLELEENVLLTIQDSITKQTSEVVKLKKEYEKSKKEQANDKENSSDNGQKEKVIKEVDFRRAFEILKFFNPKESMYHLVVMNRLLANIKITRLAHYTEKGQIVQLETFFDLDRGEVLALREKYLEFRTSI